MKIVIVGGVAGGASAAARLRRLNETAQITMYERSGYVSYANCGLPYYVGGVITDKSALTLQTPQSFFTRFNVDAKVNHEVIDIDPKGKSVTVKNLLTGEEFCDSYDKLILSPGAKAIKPNIPGIDSPRIFTLRTIEDTYALYDHIGRTKAKSALVIGGGFIGIEAAENLKHRGLDVSLSEAAPQVLAMLDEDMVSQVHASLRQHGINLFLNNGIAAFEDKGDSISCRLADGTLLDTDLVVLAIGVTPDSNLAQKAGLKTGIKGSIAVNEKMETSEAHIYAVGDAVEVTHFITKEKALISLAGPANKQGRIAADNIAGLKSAYKGTQGSSVIKVFDMTVASTGINERAARSAGINCEKIIISPASHATYYPGGSVMTVKVLFDRGSQKILGGQIVGFDGVDKRIDVLATAIRAGMLITDLAELELSYAPPYSSAKDPMNMVGFVAENIVSGRVKQFYYEDVEPLQQNKNATIIDVRTPAEYERGHADGFVNIPVDELRQRMAELPKDRPVYVMCQSGVRSYIACRMLAASGYDPYNFAGGHRFYNMVHSETLVKTQSHPCGADK